MNNLTLSEKRIIFRILNLIMKADFVINPAETKYLDNIFYEFGFDYQEFDHMEDMDLEELEKDFSTLSIEKKRYAHTLFMEMSECDGFVDPRELQIIKKFCL
jgi:hypothetical protein